MKKRTYDRLRRGLSCLLSAVLMLCLTQGAFAAPRDDALSGALEKADALYALGLFSGKDTNADGSPDYALEDAATRNEAATMLIRLMGRASKAKAQYDSGALVCPFWDTAWASPYVTWLYNSGYVNGKDWNYYGGNDPITAQQFAAMVLRSLGYTESNGDFTYAGALSFAVSKGLLTQSQSRAGGDFLRGTMVEMCYNALYLNMRDSDLTLYEKLTNDGIFRPGYDTSVAGTAALTLSPLYTGGGHTSKWSVEEPASAEPVCADVDGDGKPEIIFAVRSLYCLNAAKGSIKWSTPSGHDVSEGLSGSEHIFGAATISPIVLDIDGDGSLEIVSFFTSYPKDQTFVGIYDGYGHFKASWTTPHVVRAVKAADLNNDGRYELAMGFGVGGSGDNAVTVYDCAGAVLPGWPQRCGYGLYSNTIEAVDLDGDGYKELVMLYDEEHIAAFHLDGSEVIASGGPYAGLRWRGVPVAENYGYEMWLAEWASNHGGESSGQIDLFANRAREWRNINIGTYGGVVAADVDGNGSTELVFTSMIADGSLVMRNNANSYEGIARYFTTFILNTDRTRYANSAKGFDWTQMPTDIGDIVSLGTDKMPIPNINPVVSDLDGDGNKEIVFSSLDGKVHCFDLDGTEHGAWPYSVYDRRSSVLTFSTKPVAADVNGDGRQEVIFATYTPEDQVEVRGELFVLDHTGKVLCRVTLPSWWGYTGKGDTNYADGSRAAPVVADVDGDGRPEILVTTLTCGVCAYKVK